MKRKNLFPLLLLLIGSLTSFSQKITISDIQKKKSYEYDNESISAFRSAGNVKTGIVEINNQTAEILEVMFFHSDAPNSGVQFKLELEPGQKGFVFDKYEKKVVLANDWGIRFKLNDWESSTFLLGDFCVSTDGCFKLTISGQPEVQNEASKNNFKQNR